jgi:heme exporter protein C
LNTSSPNRATAALALASATLLVGGFALAFFWAPVDAVEGFRQKIFYLHVPVALTAYACFIGGAWKALRLLSRHESRYDLESYTAVHMGVIFGLLTLVTGSIWAKTSWGHWWSWGERQLVLFLIVFLFYSSYFMLRYSTDPGPRRERSSAVYALFGVALIPVSFLAVRIAGTILHPTVFTHDDGVAMPWEMFLAFCVCLAGMFALAATLYRVELSGKRIDASLRELREALA